MSKVFKKRLVIFSFCFCLILSSVLVYAFLNGNNSISEPTSTNNQDEIVLPDSISPSDNNNQTSGQTSVSPSPANKPSSADSTGNYLVEPVVPINTDPTPGPHINEVDHEVEEDYVWNNSDVIDIMLNDNSIAISLPSAALVDGSKITIKTAATYRLMGSLTDGQVIVDTEDKNTVRLILSNVTIHSSSSAPIYIDKAKKTIIVLDSGTKNTITDGTSYVVDADGEPNAAIFSESDLTIFGEGELNVQAHYNDGIASKDGLIIKSGQITVNAVDDGLRGKDYLVVKNGQLNINAGGDGLKSDDNDVARGYVTIENGVLQISAGRDAIDAQTDFLMNDGQITAFAGGGSSNNVVEGISTKGIKATVDLVIENGIFNIDSSDDAIHSNGTLTINFGTFNLATNDDGLHADGVLTINNGVIVIAKSYEGIESSTMIINNGNIHLISIDDGINIAGGNDGSGSQGDTFIGTRLLNINGGYIYVNANGDGLDSNGAIKMTGGQVIIDGSSSNFHTPIDHDPPQRGGGFVMTGGYILAVGSPGVPGIAPALMPNASSTQYSVMVTYNTNKTAGTLIHLRTISGTELLTFKPAKIYRSFVFCSPELTKGTYEVYLDGNSTGTIQDGLYSGGTYSPGTKMNNFTITSIVTKIPKPPG